MISDNIRRTFDDFSISWDIKKRLIKGKSGISNRMEILLDNYVSDDHTILDVGCGTGKVYEIIRKKYKKKCVVDMVDFSDNMCSMARAKSLHDTNATVYCTNLNDFKPYKRYDIITSLQVIQHMPLISKFLINSSTLMKSSGFLLVQTVGEGYLSNIFGFKINNHELDPLGRFSRQELEREIKYANLDVVGFYKDEFYFYFEKEENVLKFIESIGTLNKINGYNKGYMPNILKEIKTRTINGEYYTIVIRKDENDK